MKSKSRRGRTPNHLKGKEDRIHFILHKPTRVHGSPILACVSWGDDGGGHHIIASQGLCEIIYGDLTQEDVRNLHRILRRLETNSHMEKGFAGFMGMNDRMFHVILTPRIRDAFIAIAEREYISPTKIRNPPSLESKIATLTPLDNTIPTPDIQSIPFFKMEIPSRLEGGSAPWIHKACEAWAVRDVLYGMEDTTEISVHTPPPSVGVIQARAKEIASNLNAPIDPWQGSLNERTLKPLWIKAKNVYFDLPEV